MLTLKQLGTKVSNMITRAILQAAAKEVGGQMFIQVEALADEPHSDVEYRQPYGHKARPPKGTRCILIAIGGDKSNLTAFLADSKEIDTDVPYEPGEARQFDDKGARLRTFDQKHEADGLSYLWKIDAQNQMFFEAGSLIITVGGQTYKFETAQATFSKDLIADGISVKTHIHGGVETGGGVTAVPQ